MPNYNLVINSQFKPFSYQEMLAPVLMATQAHQELESQYEELATKANVWEEMANEQTDPYAYQMYKTYANDLESQAGQLAREGLNATSRKNMLNMRSRYSKEITPIELAYSTRQKQAEEQQKALLQDPTLMLSRRAATTSLDDYIRNPQLAYESYSGKLITAQAANAASALAKQMQEQPRKWRSILNDSYYETIMRKGFSTDAVLQAIQGNPQASQELTRIIEDAIDSSGVRNWGDQATIERATDYARQGLWSAVGETQYQTLDDWRAKVDYENNLKATGLGIAYKPKSTSHIETSGDLARYYNAQQALMAISDNGSPELSSKLFGKTGKINPLKVYEEYNKLLLASTPYRETEGIDVSTPTKKAKETALTTIKNTYGVESIIDSDTYNALKELGYDSESESLSTDLYSPGNTINDKINRMAATLTEYSFNGDISDLAKDLNKNIAVNENRGASFANRVTILDSKMNSTSKKFKPKDYKDIDIIDFGYTLKHKDKIIVTYADGTKVAVDPSLISDQMQYTINDFLENEYDEDSYKDNTSVLYLMNGLTKQAFRGFNQSIPGTNAKLS